MKTIRKEGTYMLKDAKGAILKRRKREYPTTLKEQHDLAHKAQEFKIKVGDVVMNKWNDERIIQEIYQGKDQVIRAVRIKTSKGYL